MKSRNKFDSTTTTTTRRALPSILALTVLLSSGVAAAAEDKSGLSTNFTPVLLLPHGEYDFGGGVDPELKYSVDLGQIRLSAGGRLGAYYAKNLLGVTVMPTLRMMVPMGSLEPYVAFGMGYGWLPKVKQEGIASMSRIGFVYRFSKSFGIGLEGTVQQINGSAFQFPSVGSMASFDL